MKYFITGATGFIGGKLAEMLAKQGHELTAIARDPEKAGDLRDLGIRVVQGDITEKESMRAPMAGVDGVYHVAGWYKVGARDKSPAHRINVEGTRNVLELMKELGIKKGVYTSTLATNSDTRGIVVDESYRFTGRHISVYDRTKAKAHEVALDFIAKGLPLVIVMPGLVYGPDGTSMTDESLRLFLRRKLPVIPKKSAVNWAHVDDTAAAHILAMERAEPGTTYIIAGPPHTAEEAFAMASRITGLSKPVAVPPVMLRLGAYMAAVVEQFVPLPEMYSSESLRVQAGVTYLGDNSKARRELGYAPRPLYEGLKETLEHEKKNMEMQ